MTELKEHSREVSSAWIKILPNSLFYIDTETSFVYVRIVCKNPSNAQEILKMKKKVFPTNFSKIVCKSFLLKMPIIFFRKKVESIFDFIQIFNFNFHLFHLKMRKKVLYS